MLEAAIRAAESEFAEVGENPWRVCGEMTGRMKLVRPLPENEIFAAMAAESLRFKKEAAS